MNIILNSIILFVYDVDKLKHFYIGCLGLGLVEEIQSEWVRLKAGPSELALHKIGSQYLQDDQLRGKLNNNSKIVFDVDGDIHSIHKRLMEKNVVVRDIKTWDNFEYWVFDGEDPEGNVFQLRQRK